MDDSLSENYFKKRYGELHKILNDIKDLNFYIECNFELQGESLDDIDTLKKYKKRLDYITKFRETYETSFDGTLDKIDKLSEFKDITLYWQNSFEDLKNSFHKSFDALEASLIKKYKQNNIGNITCIQLGQSSYQISVKSKGIPIEFLIELRTKKPFSSSDLGIRELVGAEDYSIELLSIASDKNLSKKVIIFEKFIEELMEMMIESNTYRPFVYDCFDDIILTKLCKKEPDLKYHLTPVKGAYDWQTRALYEFLNGKNGNLLDKYHLICEAATGTGKTRLAMMCIEKIINRDENAVVRVIVPTIALMLQWKKSIKDDLHVPDEEIRLMGGTMSSAKVKEQYYNKFSIYVINTARKELPSDVANSLGEKRLSSFIIADECHHYYSEENIKAFNGIHSINRNPDTAPGYYSLALSATPYSPGFEQLQKQAASLIELSENFSREKFMFDLLGPNKYTYNFVRAIADNTIADLHIVNVDCHLNEGEKTKVKKLRYRLKKVTEAFHNYCVEFRLFGNPLPQKYNKYDEKYFGSPLKSAICISRTEQGILKEIRKKRSEIKHNSHDFKSDFDKWLKETPYYNLVYLASLVDIALQNVEEVIDNCETRKAECLELAQKHSDNKTIIFSKTIEATDDIYLLLSNHISKDKLLLFHSKIESSNMFRNFKKTKRLRKEDCITEYLKQFKDGPANILCTAKIIDEGIDIPDASVGIIYQGTFFERQNIQRLGRIIRNPAENQINPPKEQKKKIAVLYWFYNSDCDQRPFLDDYFSSVRELAATSDNPESKKLKQGLNSIEFSHIKVLPKVKPN